MKATFFRLISGLLIAVILTAAAGCGSSKDSTFEPATPTPETTEAAPSAASGEAAPAPAPASEAAGHKEAYRQFLLNYVAQNGEDSERWFGFIYLDNDDIPELTISEGTIHAAGVEIYTCKNSKVEQITALDVYGACMYVSKQGLLYYSFLGQGGETESLFEYKNGEVNCIWAAENDRSMHEDEAQAKYFVFVKEVSMAEYEAEYSKQVESRNFIRTPHPEDNNSFSLTKQSIQSCNQL